MRTLIIATAVVVMAASAAWADGDYNSSRSNKSSGAVAEEGNDPVVRKRPGRVKYGDITLKRGVVGATAPAAQIDPPSMQLDAGPADTSAKKKPKEIVVVGSKAKKTVRPEVDDEVLVDQEHGAKFNPDGTPVRATTGTR